MLQAEQVEELVLLISALDRPALLCHLASFDAGFPVDFTPDFLERQSIERLRHLLLAMCLHCQRLPLGRDAAPETAA